MPSPETPNARADTSSPGLSLERMQALLESSWDILSLLDGEGRLIYNSAAAQRLHGLDAADMDGHSTFEFMHPEDAPRVGEALKACLARPGEPVRVQYRYAQKERGWIWMEAVAVNRLTDPAIEAIVVNSRDITERVAVKEALREASTRLQLASASAALGVWECDPDTGGMVWDDRMFELYGVAKGTFIPCMAAWEGQLHPEDLPAARAVVHEALEGDGGFHTEFRVRSDGGGYRHIQADALVVRSADGRPLRMIGLNRDVTATRRIEQALRESEARYRGLFQNMVQGFALCRVHFEGEEAVDFTYVEVNAAFTAQTGLQNVVGRRVTEVIPGIRAADPELFARYGRVVRTGIPERFEYFVSAMKMWVSVSVYRPMEGHFVALFDVITERKRAEEERILLERQLHRSQKMESLGSLAGGVAHDMNNVLGSILGLASLHEELQPAGSPAQEAFATIAKACDRGGRLARRLLDFARQDLSEVKELDLNALLREEAQLLERTTLAQVRLSLDLAGDLRPVRGGASALTHAVMNLCVNAADAMPGGGDLTLRTRNGAEGWVEVEVVDSGSGMPKEVLDKALDPFFTTKPQGKGTGLGLSIVYGTVKAHQGTMEIFSEPGKGTRVVMRFPACEPGGMQDADPAPVAPESASRPLDILLVDDDELIRSSLEAMLRVLGHRVACAESGESALAWLEADRHPQAIILDMNMPGLGGAGTLPRLRALHPGVPVLLATGRADQAAHDLTQSFPGVSLLPKPFSLAELRKRLEAIASTTPRTN